MTPPASSRATSFWRDFLSGLAGPGPAGDSLVADGRDALSDAVAAAKADVLQRCEMPAAKPTWFDGQPLGKGSLFVITSMFDGIASLARSANDDARSSINLFKSIERLTGNHARETGGGDVLSSTLVTEATTD